MIGAGLIAAVGGFWLLFVAAAGFSLIGAALTATVGCRRPSPPALQRPADARHVSTHAAVPGCVSGLGADPPKLDGVSAQAGWYPDPGGVANLYRYWDGQAWSAATRPTRRRRHRPRDSSRACRAAAQARPVRAARSEPVRQQNGYGQNAYGQGQPAAYADFQTAQQRKSPVGWWIAAAALLVVIIVVGVIAVRAIGGSSGTTGGGPGQPSQDVCPTSSAEPEHRAERRPERRPGARRTDLLPAAGRRPGRPRGPTTGSRSAATCRSSR